MVIMFEKIDQVERELVQNWVKICKQKVDYLTKTSSWTFPKSGAEQFSFPFMSESEQKKKKKKDKGTN